MKILDIDLDYFMDTVASFIDEDSSLRLDEECYGESVWSETQVRDFLENNLGLSKERKIQGRVVRGHNESLIFWKELIFNKVLSTPFEVVHDLTILEYLSLLLESFNFISALIHM